MSVRLSRQNAFLAISIAIAPLFQCAAISQEAKTAPAPVAARERAPQNSKTEKCLVNMACRGYIVEEDIVIDWGFSGIPPAKLESSPLKRAMPTTLPHGDAVILFKALSESSKAKLVFMSSVKSDAGNTFIGRIVKETTVHQKKKDEGKGGFDNLVDTGLRTEFFSTGGILSHCDISLVSSMPESYSIRHNNFTCDISHRASGDSVWLLAPMPADENLGSKQSFLLLFVTCESFKGSSVAKPPVESDGEKGAGNIRLGVICLKMPSSLAAGLGLDGVPSSFAGNESLAKGRFFIPGAEASSLIASLRERPGVSVVFAASAVGENGKEMTNRGIIQIKKEGENDPTDIGFTLMVAPSLSENGIALLWNPTMQWLEGRRSTDVPATLAHVIESTLTFPVMKGGATATVSCFGFNDPDTKKLPGFAKDDFPVYVTFLTLEKIDEGKD